MSRRRRRGPGAAAVLAATCVSLAALTVPGLLAPAAAAPAGDPAVLLAAAAVGGAGDAASTSVADRAESAGAAVGGAAARWTPPTTTATTSASGGLARRWTWQGWVSGAAGREAEDGSFATWRGKPLGIVGVWADTSAEAQRDLDAVDAYDGYNGQMDVALGALVRGETWQEAAAGAYVDRWTTAIRTLAAKRAGKGTTYIRIAHEMNGDWMAWGVDSSDVEAYKKAYRLYAGIVRKEFPQARLTWSPNGGNHSTASIDQLYPGDDVVDVVGPDIYDGYPDVTSLDVWNDNLYAMTGTSPKSIGAWQRWAARRGKPLAMPEWGLPYGDHPAFVEGMNQFLRKYAATPGSSTVAGKVVYDVYFNVEDKFKIYPGPNTTAGAKYVSLRWGS